ncbi:MAG: hypothetical protein HY737_07350 [Candidatus Omnitrophica bacterium]|nr:hypothetical protein [Candidatus Omnitrophota bacterium]
MKRLSLLIIACAAFTPLAAAAEDVATLRQDVQRLAAVVQELSATVQAQQRRLTLLEGEAGGQTPQLPIVPLPPGVIPSGGGANLSALNPEIGVVADIAGQLSESSADGEGNDKLSVREIELIFGHPIDPYSRFDVNVTFSDFEEAGLEEAYITHWGLPGELVARLGRFRQRVGKASGTHTELLDTVDTPLVVTKYLGAEGLFRTGAEITGFLPAPWDAVTHEVTAGIMEGGVGEGGTLFGETRRRPSYYAHLKNFWDVSDSTNLEVGSTYLLGSKDADRRYEVHAFGVDTTFIHYVTPTNKLKWQNEMYFQSRKESLLVETAEGTGEEISAKLNKHPWGFYSLLDYRLSPRFGLGGRFDYVEPVDLDPRIRARDADTAWSGYATFYQSEFARWRLQFKHTNFAAGGDDNSIFAQCTVAIGVHKHQLQ